MRERGKRERVRDRKRQTGRQADTDSQTVKQALGVTSEFRSHHCRDPDDRKAQTTKIKINSRKGKRSQSVNLLSQSNLLLFKNPLQVNSFLTNSTKQFFGLFLLLLLGLFLFCFLWGFLLLFCLLWFGFSRQFSP